MARITDRQYRRVVFALMTLYVALLLLVWPQAKNSPVASLKVLYALAPVAPLLGVIWLMARRIMQSDELEQRTHLIGLGVATAAVSIFTLIGGFLATAKVLPQDDAAIVLLWVFPVLMATYAFVRSRVARRYGGSGCDEADSPVYRRFFEGGCLVSAIAAYAYFYKHDELMAGVASGMATTFLLAGLYFGLRRRWTRRQRVDE